MTQLSGVRKTRIGFVGDMMFDTRVVPPRTFFLHEPQAICGSRPPTSFAYPFVNDESSRTWLVTRGHSLAGLITSSHITTAIPLPSAASASFDTPFAPTRSVLGTCDLVVGNLESPLSERGRPLSNDAYYRADPGFAPAIAAAGIRVVSFANNHCMDFGEVAFADTLEALDRAGITVIGAGRTMSEASTPAFRTLSGIRVALLGFCMVGSEVIYATEDESGVVPLNDLTARKAIEGVRLTNDLIVLSVHWGAELMVTPPADLVALAHRLIDYGADVIVGHHSHIPSSVEWYKNRPIVYSVGNYVFGHAHHFWPTSVVAVAIVDGGRISAVQLTPLDTRGEKAFAPVPLQGDDARRFCEQLEKRCRQLNSHVELVDSIAVVTPTRHDASTDMVAHEPEEIIRG